MAFRVYIRQNDDNQFRDITYTRSLTEGKDFFLKKIPYTGYDTDVSQNLV